MTSNSIPESPAIGATPALDYLGLAGLLVAAFFFGSVPARNPELFAHLAAGRHLLSGGESVPGAGGTWLFDAATFAHYRAGGGTILVIAKALAMAGFVALTFLATRLAGAPRREGVYLGIPAVLAVVPFIGVEPVVIAYLAFAAILALLWSKTASPTPPRHAWLAVPLALLWANSAGSAILAPLTVGCFALGAGKRTGWWVMAAATLVASLASPDPLQALRLPGVFDVQPPDVFRQEGWGALGSPLARSFWKSSAGYGPLGVALGISIILPLIVIARSGRRLPVGAVAMWLLMAGLALGHWRAIPLLAVAAAVLLGVAFTARGAVPAAELRSRRATGLAGLLTIVWAVALPAAAWTGWLQAPPFGAREWRTEPDPSMAAAADWLHDRGVGRAFPLSPAAGDILAWFSPAQRPAVTSLSSLAERDAAAAVARALTDADAPWTEAARQDVRAALRAAGATHIIVAHPDGNRFTRALIRLLAQPGEFVPLWWRGRAVAFGWRDPAATGAPDPFPADRLDLSPNSPEADWRVPAPEAGPPSREPDTWANDFRRARPPRTADRDEATVALTFFNYQQQVIARGAEANPFAFEATQFAGLTAASLSPNEIPLRFLMGLARYTANPTTGQPTSPAGSLGFSYLGEVERLRRDGPVGSLFRGVRAARRAIAANSEDAAAYQAMGACYMQLRRSTRDRLWCRVSPALGRVRTTQIAYACTQALRIDSNLLAAHVTLAELFTEVRFNDAALRHAREAARLRRLAGPDIGGSAGQYEAALKFIDDNIAQLERAVKGGEDALAAVKVTRPLDRANAALRAGLAEKALATLLESDIAAFGKEGVVLELNLLLGLGRAAEARAWLPSTSRDELGADLYHGLRAQAAAAVGDYAESDDEMVEFAAALTPEGSLAPEMAIALQTAQLLGDGAFPHTDPFSAAIRERDRIRWRGNIVEAEGALVRRSELDARRAWLNLDRGDYAAADELAARALATAGPTPFAGRAMAEDIRAIVRGGK